MKFRQNPLVTKKDGDRDARDSIMRTVDGLRNHELTV